MDGLPPRIDEARSHLDQAGAIVEQLDADEGLLSILIERARLALVDGHFEQALTHTERVLEEASSEAVAVPMALLVRGKALVGLGRPRQASVSLRDAAKAFSEKGLRQREAECWNELGDLHLASGRPRAAANAFRAALAALDPRRTRA
jgi:tetratricopeptide (TPR) repeat protein